MSVAGCTKFAAHQKILGSGVPQISIYRLLRTFLQNSSGTIPFVSENQEKSWKHKFPALF